MDGARAGKPGEEVIGGSQRCQLGRKRERGSGWDWRTGEVLSLCVGPFLHLISS